MVVSWTNLRTHLLQYPRFSIAARSKNAEVLAAVVEHKDFAKIKSLEVVDSLPRLGNTFIRVLREGRLAHIRHLRLRYVENPSVLAAVFETLTELHALELACMDIDDATLAGLIRNNRLSSLVQLRLANLSLVGNEAAAAIASGALPSLEKLDMTYVSIGDAGLRALAEGPALRRLKKLHYGPSTCGESHGLEVKLSVAAVAAMNTIYERVDGVLFRLDLEEAPLQVAADLGAHTDPSLEAFRSIWLAPVRSSG